MLRVKWLFILSPYRLQWHGQDKVTRNISTWWCAPLAMLHVIITSFILFYVLVASFSFWNHIHVFHLRRVCPTISLFNMFKNRTSYLRYQVLFVGLFSHYDDVALTLVSTFATDKHNALVKSKHYRHCRFQCL